VDYLLKAPSVDESNTCVLNV